MAENVAAVLGNIFVIVAPEEGTVTKELTDAPSGLKQYVLILRERTY
jgi:hypothetical protein